MLRPRRDGFMRKAGHRCRALRAARQAGNQVAVSTPAAARWRNGTFAAGRIRFGDEEKRAATCRVHRLEGVPAADGAIDRLVAGDDLIRRGRLPRNGLLESTSDNASSPIPKCSE